MKTHRSSLLGKPSGFALGIVLLFLLVLTVSGFIAARATWTDIRVVSNLGDEKRALFIAEAGAQEALKRLSYLRVATTSVNGNNFDAAFYTGANMHPDETNVNWKAKIVYD